MTRLKQVVHDVRGRLTVLTANIDLLLQGDVAAADAVQYLQECATACSEISALVSSLVHQAEDSDDDETPLDPKPLPKKP